LLTEYKLLELVYCSGHFGHLSNNIFFITVSLFLLIFMIEKNRQESMDNTPKAFKTLKTIFAAALSLFLFACQSYKEQPVTRKLTYTNPSTVKNIGDPFVLKAADGAFYAGTGMGKTFR